MDQNHRACGQCVGVWLTLAERLTLLTNAVLCRNTFRWLGIGAILDYCAEADMDHEDEEDASEHSEEPALPAMPELDTFPASQIRQYTVNPKMMDRRQGFGQSARTYFFEDSATCDANMEICRCNRTPSFAIATGLLWCLLCRYPLCLPSPSRVCFTVTSASRSPHYFPRAYRTAITTAAAQTVAPFAAIKITALLEPKAMVRPDLNTLSVSLSLCFACECEKCFILS